MFGDNGMGIGRLYRFIWCCFLGFVGAGRLTLVSSCGEYVQGPLG